MFRRWMITLIAASLGAALTGCQGNRELTQKVLTMEKQSGAQFQLLKQHNEVLNRKVNRLNETVNDLTKMNSELSEELATYANRPDEVKIEIISEVNTRFGAIASDLESFKTNLTENVDERFSAMDQKMETDFTEMTRVLDHHTAFVEFVSAEQDSINRVMANKIDSRPWYQSIVGKWEDQQLGEGQAP